jgi:PAS domain S-box-containing protein
VEPRADPLDEFAELAAALCNTPMASVRFVESTMRSREVRFGSTFAGGELAKCFTSALLGTSNVLVVPDTRADLRFRDDPSVTGEPFIRFWAGLALVAADGSVLGTLGVFDVRPRTLSDSQLRHLQLLAGLLMACLEPTIDAGHRAEPDTQRYAALAESEQRWRALVEHSPVAVAVIAADGRFVYANPGALRLYGANSADDIEGRSAVDFSPALEQPGVAELFGSVIAGEQTLHDPRWHLKQLGGDEVTVEINATAATYRGEPAVQVELRDISVKAAAEQALADSERRFRAVFTGSPAAMGILDEAALWVEGNSALGTLLGIESSQLPVRSVAGDVHPDDRASIAGIDTSRHDTAHRANIEGDPQLQIRFVRPSGEIRWAWVSTAPTTGPAGQGWTLLIAQDVTARQAAENALQESESELAAIAAVARCVQAGQDPRPIVVDSLRQMAGRRSLPCWNSWTRTPSPSLPPPGLTWSAGGSCCRTGR